jgi:aspartate aminotransferase
MDLDESQMIVTVGGSEAIVLAMMCVADPGDEIIVFDPSYTNYCGFATAAAATLVPIALDAATAFHLPPAEVLEAAISSRTRAMLVCNPNNPTGSVYSEAELRTVLAVAARHGLFVIADEVYREFVFDGRTHTGMLTLPGAAERTILVDSVSKRFNACGARVGCLASYHREVMQAALHLAQARLSAPTVEQLAMVPLLEHAAAYTQALAGAYQRRRDAAVAALAAIPGVRFTIPEGAFYMILDLPVDDAERFARWLLEEFSDEGESVMVAPLRGFYATPGRGAQAVRLAFVLAEAALVRAIEILGRGLAAYPGRTGDGWSARGGVGQTGHSGERGRVAG